MMVMMTMSQTVHEVTITKTSGIVKTNLCEDSNDCLRDFAGCAGTSELWVERRELGVGAGSEVEPLGAEARRILSPQVSSEPL